MPPYPVSVQRFRSTDTDCTSLDEESKELHLHFSMADEQATLAYRIELMQQVDLVQALDSELLPGLAKALVPKTFGPNETIIEVGEPADCMYFVERGTADVIKDGAVVWTYESRGFFGEKGLVDNAPRAATVVAGDRGVGLFRLRKDVFNAIKTRVSHALEERQEMYEETDFGGGGAARRY